MLPPADSRTGSGSRPRSRPAMASAATRSSSASRPPPPLDDALEALDADRLDQAARSRGLEHAQRGVGVAQAAAAVRDADLDEHLEPATRQRLDAGHRVDEAIDLGVRVGQPTDRARIEHLVGDQDPLDAEVRHHLRLADGRGGDAPRAGRQLIGEQLRRHRRLAVRREADAVLVAEPHHAPEVVLEPVAAQRQRRQQEVARPQREAELADAPERDAGERVGQALRADAERRIEDRVELDRPSLEELAPEQLDGLDVGVQQVLHGDVLDAGALVVAEPLADLLRRADQPVVAARLEQLVRALALERAELRRTVAELALAGADHEAGHDAEGQRGRVAALGLAGLDQRGAPVGGGLRRGVDDVVLVGVAGGEAGAARLRPRP